MAVIYAKNKTTGEWERVSPETAVIDSTLTLKGAPADAKATGDALEEIRNQIDNISDNISFDGLATEDYVDSKFDEVSEQIVNNIAKPDWNQSDENAADYIKNRPFYESVSLIEVYTGNNIEFVNNNNVYMAQVDSAGASLYDGKTYKIHWDGVEYTRDSYIFQSLPCIGNLNLIGAGEDTGEPFLLYDATAMVGSPVFVFGTSDSSPTHSISIFVNGAVVKTIEPKYIKDMYYDNGVTETVLVEEQTVSGFSVMQDPIYAVENPFVLNLVVGNTYIVNWDGTEYEVIASVSQGMIYAGNENYVSMTSGGDIPFTIINSNASIFLATESTAESHTISVVETMHDMKQIDMKYLPIMKEDNSVFVIDEKYLPSTSSVDLTFDETPTEGSTNPVTSEGIKAYVDSKEFVLPEGYPVSENVVIEWDGDTAGKTSVAVAISIGSMDSIPFYKVSDLILTNDEIKSATCTNVQYGNVISGKISSEVWDGSMASGYIAEDITFVAGMAIVRKAGAVLKKNEAAQVTQDAIFEETGIYFQKYSDTMYVSGIEATTTTTMSPTLLPSDIAYKSYVDEKCNEFATEEYINIRVPAWTDEDEGKFLRIVNGTPTWTTVNNAEEAIF